jgi:hypothetical protein
MNFSRAFAASTRREDAIDCSIRVAGCASNVPLRTASPVRISRTGIDGFSEGRAAERRWIGDSVTNAGSIALRPRPARTWATVTGCRFSSANGAALDARCAVVAVLWPCTAWVRLTRIVSRSARALRSRSASLGATPRIRARSVMTFALAVRTFWRAALRTTAFVTVVSLVPRRCLLRRARSRTA